MRGEFEKACRYNQWRIEAFESYPLILEEETEDYLWCLNNYIITQNLLKDYAGALQTIEKVKQVPLSMKGPVGNNLNAIAFECSFFHQLENYIYTGRFEEGVALMPEIEAGLGQFRDKLKVVNLHSKYFRIALIWFGAGRLTESLTWMNRILNDSEVIYRKDIRVSVRIFNLILHFEIGNEDLLESLVKSTYRYLIKLERLYDSEKEVLNFIKKLPGINGSAAFEAACYKLDNALELKLKDNPFEAYAFSYFDIRSFLRSKLEHCSFAEAVRRKAKTIV